MLDYQNLKKKNYLEKGLENRNVGKNMLLTRKIERGLFFKYNLSLLKIVESGIIKKNEVEHSGNKDYFIECVVAIGTH